MAFNESVTSESEGKLPMGYIYHLNFHGIVALSVWQKSAREFKISTTSWTHVPESIFIIKEFWRLTTLQCEIIDAIAAHLGWATSDLQVQHHGGFGGKFSGACRAVDTFYSMNQVVLVYKLSG